jgi:hypothetical protein
MGWTLRPGTRLNCELPLLCGANRDASETPGKRLAFKRDSTLTASCKMHDDKARSLALVKQPRA